VSDVLKLGDEQRLPAGMERQKSTLLIVGIALSDPPLRWVDPRAMQRTVQAALDVAQHLKRAERLAQRLGIPLAEIGEALKNLPQNRAPTAADWKTLSAQWSRSLDERINQLIALRDRLNGCIGCGCLSMENCPLRNQGDVLGKRGPGAHLLEEP
jgi:redox-sensitive transcriptional activator SoxR